MRVLYKALASAGMILLSTAAAIGIRHLRIKSQKQTHPNPSTDSSPNTSDEAKEPLSPENPDPTNTESTECDKSQEETHEES